MSFFLEDGQEDVEEEAEDSHVRVLTSTEQYKDSVCLAYKTDLVKLAQAAPKHTCSVKGCGLPYSIVDMKIGTCMCLIWVSCNYFCI